MQRSDVNDILRSAQAFVGRSGVILPPFARWSPQQMRSPQAAPLRARGLGWDVTDYGRGQFDSLGLVLFTSRNGRVADLERGRGMLYAEKSLVSRQNQISPMHRHISKTEDIINRGGGMLILELFAAAEDGSVDRAAEVVVLSDGMKMQLPAGGHMRLEPGQSVTLTPGIWHAFWAERADCLIGEVSTVNDDRSDNVFADRVDRFAKITEDEDPLHLLVSDY